MLFKIMLLQRWYNLSDPAVEDALNDRKSFARFVGLRLDQNAPDFSVISRFRTQLVHKGLMQPLFDELARQIDTKQLVLRQGTLLDATLIASAARPPGAPRKPANPPPRHPHRPTGKPNRPNPTRKISTRKATPICAQAGVLAEAVRAATGDNVELAWVDRGYTGETAANAAAEHGVKLEIVKLDEAVGGVLSS